ncbi:MAG: FixH family protein [Rhodocyclales bacterium]|nr:FixH family protein [Rhodocyclales bacterium]
MNRAATMEPSKPWYREPWPWLLMAGPAVVVVAGFVTAWLAISSNDGLVTDDYYKKGLVVDQTLARSRLAAEQGIEARLRLASDRVVVAISRTGDAAGALPAKLRLTLSHPTRAGLDQTVELRPAEQQQYAADLRLPASGHWLVLIEDDAQTWRLMGNVVLPAQGETLIGGGTTTGNGG